MKNRIRLERFAGEAEFPYFAELAFNEAVMHMNMGRIFTQEEAQAYYANILEYNRSEESSGTYKIFLRRGGSYIGICSLWRRGDAAEVEYMLLPAYWGNGYATEAVARLVATARQIPGVRKISGLIDPENTSSKNVLLKNGFAHEAHTEIEEDGSAAEILSLPL
ncbi:MAG: GNAT family N-acetyltransferase [Oscillospiraceae bacterium]|nr:GNAT family N-acetyltransferase [Oscillospiraceae bacterium]